MKRLVSMLLLAVVLTATGCASTPSTQGPAQAAATTDCPETSVRLADLPLTDVHTAHGGSTACIPGRAIEAVTNTSAPSLPVTVTDSEGHLVTITDTSRILAVDIAGTIAATVFALGLGDNVVGRDSSTGFLGTENLPVVTKSGHTLNPEAILALAPTVLLTDTTIGPKEVRQQLRDAGIAVVMISDERRLDTISDHVTEVATALGVPERGASLISKIDAELRDALAEIAEVTPTDDAERARILFLYVRGNANIYYIFGRDSGADSLIEAIGGIDVASEIGWEGMRPMTAEALVASQPDVVLMMTDGLESVGGIDGLISRIPALAETPAGANRRVIDMADTDILSFGPRTAEVVRALARALYAPTGNGAGG